MAGLLIGEVDSEARLIPGVSPLTYAKIDAEIASNHRLDDPGEFLFNLAHCPDGGAPAGQSGAYSTVRVSASPRSSTLADIFR